MTTTALEMNKLEFKPELIVSDEMYQAFLFFLYQLKGQKVAEGKKPKVRFPNSKLSGPTLLTCLAAAQKSCNLAHSSVFENVENIIQRHKLEIKKFEHVDKTIFTLKRPRKKLVQ